MREDRLMTLDAPELTERTVYPLRRRMRRAWLRRTGRWTRGDYDVRIVYAGTRPLYKKVVFNQASQAKRVAAALTAFGPSEHIPGLRLQRDHAVWVDYVAGERFDPQKSGQTGRVADCFAAFAGRGSQPLSVDEMGCDARIARDLDWLVGAGIIQTSLARALGQRARHEADRCMLRRGFDYSDPIAANLLARADTGALCAIDIKNVRCQALVGLGLAKAHARWLDDTALACVFDRLSDAGLGDVVAAWEYIRLYERITRVARQATTERQGRGGVRKRDDKIAKLAELVT